MKLRYTAPATIELETILKYITERSPQGARKVLARIQAITTLLLQQPYSGHLTNRRGLRRMAASPYPYLIFYRVIDDEVVIYRIRHSARKSTAI